MIGCGATTGILFSRKPCAQPAAVNCGRCKTPLCKQHLRPQAQGPFLCQNCDAYEHDDDWRYSSRDNSWRYSSSSRTQDQTATATTGAAAGAAAGSAAASDLSDEDKAGLSLDGSGAAEAGGGESDAGNDADGDSEGSDFDAS